MKKQRIKTRSPHRLRHAASTALVAASIACSAQAGAANTLTLPKFPLIGGQTVDPNVLVAFDDSGSMSNELLFDNRGGALFWRPENEGTAGFFDSNNQYIDVRYNFRDKYSNLFPENRGITENGEGTVPPFARFAFARSAAFNKQYFDPAVTYKPWPGDEYSDARTINNIHAVPYRPRNTSDTTIDLAPESGQDRGEFSVKKGMQGLEGVPADVPSGFNAELDYFPATFYIEANSVTAAQSAAGGNFASYDDANIKPVDSLAPNRAEMVTLYRFEIRKANFDDENDYEAAIENFANWFTYHRTRALATKGALVRAFDNVDNIRTAACTINDRETLYAKKLSDNRAAFNEKIFGFDIGGGTPDALALNHLGKQFEDNRGESENIIQSPCQKNYAILFTDGYNKSKVSGIGNVDGESKNPNLQDDYANTMGDIGAHYYSDLDVDFLDFATNEVRVSPACDPNDNEQALDCNTNQHVTMFAVTLGQNGNVYNGEQSPDPYRTDDIDWPAASTDPNPSQIDDLWHATVNSYGELLNAARPDQLVDKFSQILRKVSNSRLAGSGLTTNRHTISSKTLAFRATFTDREGSLEAFKLDNSAALDVDKRRWSAHAVNFQGDKNNPAARAIYTSSLDSDGALGKGVVFKSSNRDKFGFDSESEPYTAKQIRYLRGDHSDEQQNGGDLRNRNGHVLGAIVHSTPAFVPELPDRASYLGRFTNSDSDSQSYSDFQEDTRGRSAMVYVEANDGMLHGFDADTGEEKFAFIPGAVLSSLRYLTDPDNPDFFYADGTPAVGDVVYDKNWHTVLVAGERSGGASVFALDVTDPDSFDAEDVLWEASNKTDRIDHLGKTFGKPAIVRLNNGRWAAVFGNGYNSPDNKAVLYVVDIQTGELSKKFDVTNRDGTPDRSGPNGLSAPVAADVDGDAVTDYVYAGDLHGNLWRFDLAAASKDAWKASRLYTTSAYEGDKPRPITGKPNVSRATGTRNGLLVAFGSGRFITEQDAEQIKDQTNYLYGLWDANATLGNAPPDNALTGAITSDQLVKQTRIGQKMVDGRTVVAVSDKPVDYPDDRGWRLDLTLESTGQAATNQPFIGRNGTRLTFTATVPSKRVCEPGGTGSFYQIDPSTGGRTSFISFDVTGDSSFNDADRVFTITDDDGNEKKVAVSGIVTTGIPSRAAHLTDTDNANVDRSTSLLSSTDTTTLNLNRGPSAGGRVSWHEIRR